MADLILDWGLLGPYNSALTAGATATVDTGGVAVDITFTQADPGAEAFTFSTDGYVAPGEPFDPNSHLKLFGDGGDDLDTVNPTSMTVLNFRSSDDAYTDNIQNVSFRLNDVAAGMGEDLAGPVHDNVMRYIKESDLTDQNPQMRGDNASMTLGEFFRVQ